MGKYPYITKNVFSCAYLITGGIRPGDIVIERVFGRISTSTDSKE